MTRVTRLVARSGFGLALGVGGGALGLARWKGRGGAAGAGAGARAGPTQVLRIRPGGGSAGLYKPPRVRRCAWLAAKIVPTCLRVPRRSGPPAGPSVRQSHAGPMAFPLVRAAAARRGGAGPRSWPQQLTVRAQPQPVRAAPSPAPVRAGPGLGAGHVPGGVGPRGGMAGGGQGASS